MVCGKEIATSISEAQKRCTIFTNPPFLLGGSGFETRNTSLPRGISSDETAAGLKLST